MYKTENQREPTVQHRELYSVLCGDLNGKEIQKGGDVCIYGADSLCCAAETNKHRKATILKKKKK